MGMTSSYGDGEAPSGFGKFLYHIYTAAADAKKNTDAAVLSGMEHSVLGFGSTVYYTFQNVPRLCDRLLGESGSRRFLMRNEIGAGPGENSSFIAICRYFSCWCCLLHL